MFRKYSSQFLKKYPYLATHKVKKGETLSGIASKYRVPMKDILARNPRIKDPNKIQAGWMLYIPSFKEIKALRKIEAWKKQLPSELSKKTPKFSRWEILKSALVYAVKGRPGAKKAFKEGVESLISDITGIKKRQNLIEEKVKQKKKSLRTALKLVDKSFWQYPKEGKWKVPDPEDIEKQQIRSESKNLKWESQPNWFKRTFDKLAWKTKAKIAGEDPMVYGLKKEVQRTFPLTNWGKTLTRAIKVQSGKWTTPLHDMLLIKFRTKTSEWTPKDDFKIKTAIWKKLPSVFKKIIPKPLEPRGKIELRKLDSYDLMHEILHSNFMKTIYDPYKIKGVKAFNKAWLKAREENPLAIAIVDKALKRYNKYLVDKPDYLKEYILAQERYAWFGSTFGKKGIGAFPVSLRPWYKTIFH